MKTAARIVAKMLTSTFTKMEANVPMKVGFLDLNRTKLGFLGVCGGGPLFIAYNLWQEYQNNRKERPQPQRVENCS